MDTNEWVAVGTLATALFTGFAAAWTVALRPKPKMRIELKELTSTANNFHVNATFAFRNVGTGKALEVRVFVTVPELPDKQMIGTVASLASGEEVTLTRSHRSRTGEDPIDEATGMYPSRKPDFDAGEMGVAVTWTQPPLNRRTRRLRARESELLRDHHARHFPLD